MAKVTLEVEVRREQVDKLQNAINGLKRTKIKLDASDFTKTTKEATTATEKLQKAEDNALKTETDREKKLKELTEAAKELLKVEEELATKLKAQGDSSKEALKAEKERAKTLKELERSSKAMGTSERERLKTERERIKNERELLKQEQDRERLTQQQLRTERERQRATQQAAQGHRNAAKAVKEHSMAQDILGRSVGSFLARMTAYRAVYGIINTITASFKEAIRTLKAVDDELVTVRKVTGFDASQMAEVESQAYSVASRYGSSASDYVAGVASFARAGYKELSGDLAELSTKTQIVGDTTAETANQFLISVDAAYKYKGSVTELSRVLDGANELDNKYATSIEKIAEGMGIVAPVAAQMHVGVDELAASIGTITAVTQRSGKHFLAA